MPSRSPIGAFVPRFKITLELRTVEALSHGDARRAAQRVGDAIEQLECEKPGWEGAELVQVTRMTIEHVPRGRSGTGERG